jgi:hypothetical protein
MSELKVSELKITAVTMPTQIKHGDIITFRWNVSIWSAFKLLVFGSITMKIERHQDQLQVHVPVVENNFANALCSFIEGNQSPPPRA